MCKATLKDEWVAALRSGKYKKGLELLKWEWRGEEFHCSLGVLAQILCDKYPDQFKFERNNVDKNAYMLLDVATDWRLQGILPDITFIPWLTKSLQIQIARFNDKDYKSFDEIADWIESNVNQ